MTRLSGCSLLAAVLLAACASQGDYPARMAAEHEGDKPIASPLSQQPLAAPVVRETVTYGRQDGKPLRGYLARPEGRARGGVLVLHEWWGLNDNIRAMADLLAAEGYLALAVDTYGGARAETPAEARALMQASLEPRAPLLDNLYSGLRFLQAEGAERIVTLGWCYGGMLSLEAAVHHPQLVDGAVIYYGFVRSTPEDLRRIDAPVLGVFGGADQGIPVATVKDFEAQMRKLGKSVEIVIYQGAGHAFANPSGHNYNAAFADDAWRRTLAFLDQQLGR